MFPRAIIPPSRRGKPSDALHDTTLQRPDLQKRTVRLTYIHRRFHRCGHELTARNVVSCRLQRAVRDGPVRNTGKRAFHNPCCLSQSRTDEIFNKTEISNVLNDTMDVGGAHHRDEHPSEANIQAFHETFGGSARDAYEHANELEAFESLVDATANRFSATDIEHIITTPNLELEIPGNIGHALLSAFPLGDGDRRQYQIKPPTDAMCLKVLNRLSASLDTARRHLYQICSGTSTPGCKVWAGQLFDQHYHDFLLLGGMWDLHTLQKPAGVTGNITWKPDQQPSGLSLLVHKGMMIVNGTQGAPPQLQPVPHVQFEQNNEPTTLTKGVYYRPTQRSSTTFDSFYVLNARHIIAFRAPRATTLDIKKEDVEWLATRKIKKITYVYVTPYKYDGPAHVEVPVELENSFDALYHIRLL